MAQGFIDCQQEQRLLEPELSSVVEVRDSYVPLNSRGLFDFFSKEGKGKDLLESRTPRLSGYDHLPSPTYDLVLVL